MKYQVRARRPSGHLGVYLVEAEAPDAATDEVARFIAYEPGAFMAPCTIRIEVDSVEPAPAEPTVGAIDMDEEEGT